MNFIVRNLQSVKQADISVSGVTVIASPNGFGKSTISRALSALASLNRDVAHLVQLRRFRKIIAAIREVYSTEGAEILFRPRLLRMPSGDLEILFSESFWQDPEKFGFWLSEHFGRNADGVGRLGSIYPSSFITDRKYRLQFDVLKERVMAVLRTSDEELAKEEARAALDYAFNREWASKDHENEATRVELSGDGFLSYVELLNKHHDKGLNIGARCFASAFYLEPYHVIDIAANQYSEYNETGPLRFIVSNESIAGWPSNAAVSKEDVLARLAKISRGHLSEKQSGLLYREQFFDGVERPVLPTNIASGMKPLAELARAIDKGAVLPKGLLIIDEPESNLHSEWQIQFAEFLVWLSAKCDVKVLLNTHSPYFLRAIDVSSRANANGTDRQLPVCHYYVMRRSAGDYRVESFCVDDSLDEIFSEMHRPFARLREERPIEGEVAND